MKRITLLAAAGIALGFFPANADLHAETPAPFPDFKPNFVKPPKSGARKRVNVQINRPSPAVSPSPSAQVAPSGGDSTPKAGQYDWFWTQVSPDVAQSGPGRLEKVMIALSGASTRVPAPRLQHMQDIAKLHGIDILRSTIGTIVSPALALAVISVE